MTEKQVFLIIKIAAELLSSEYSKIFTKTIDNMKMRQPEKFEYIRERMSTMLFPPKNLIDIFNAESQSVDDFLDDLLGIGLI